MFIVMHELKGASMKLIFNPCIYNSMSFVIIKKGEIVGPKPITLVLMILTHVVIVLMILCLISLRYLLKILVGV